MRTATISYHVDHRREVEDLVGANRGIVRQKLGREHCMTGVLAAARICKPKSLKRIPRELRRGWVKCIIDTLSEYRATYFSVMAGATMFRPEGSSI